MKDVQILHYEYYNTFLSELYKDMKKWKEVHVYK